MSEKETKCFWKGAKFDASLETAMMGITEIMRRPMEPPESIAFLNWEKYTKESLDHAREHLKDTCVPPKIQSEIDALLSKALDLLPRDPLEAHLQLQKAKIKVWTE